MMPSSDVRKENEIAMRVPCFGLCRFLVCIAATASVDAFPAAARAAFVTQEIDAEVLLVSNTYASFFAGADRVVGSLVYDAAVADTSPAPDTGVYPSALVSLAITIPALGFSWSADAGDVFAFPDKPFIGDQFNAGSFDDNPTGNPINGYPIKSLAVAFAGGDVDFLTSDALPGPGVRYEYGNLFLDFDDDFGTIVGRAEFVFAPEPGRIPGALAAFAGLAAAARRRRFGLSLAETRS